MIHQQNDYLPAVAWSYLKKDNHLIDTLYSLNRMKSAVFSTAISHATAPGFNVSVADSEGNIGWHVMGAIPVRPKRSQWSISARRVAWKT